MPMLAAVAAAVLQACFFAKPLPGDGLGDFDSGPACMLPGRAGRALLPVHVPCLRRHTNNLSAFEVSRLVRHAYLGVKLLRQIDSAQQM